MSWRCYSLQVRPEREERVRLYRFTSHGKEVGLYSICDRKALEGLRREVAALSYVLNHSRWKIPYRKMEAGSPIRKGGEKWGAFDDRAARLVHGPDVRHKGNKGVKDGY